MYIVLRIGIERHFNFI